jgi:hypothetical protein
MAPSRDEPNPNAHSNIAMQAIVFSDLSAAIFHELMNQVSSVDELFAYLHHIIEAKLQIDDGRMREVTDHMENCHENIRTSLERLLQLSTITGSLPGAPRRQVEAAVYDSWKEAVSILGPLLWPGGTAVEWRGERNCFIRSPEGHITQILLDVLLIPLQAFDGDLIRRKHIIAVSAEFDSESEHLKLTIDRDGQEIETPLGWRYSKADFLPSEEALFDQRIAQRERLAGLSLSIARDLLYDLGGKAGVTTYARGFSITVELPARREDL